MCHQHSAEIDDTDGPCPPQPQSQAKALEKIADLLTTFSAPPCFDGESSTLQSGVQLCDYAKHSGHGEVRERPNRAVSKTAVGVTRPWVRIPPSPPNRARSTRALLIDLGDGITHSSGFIRTGVLKGICPLHGEPTRGPGPSVGALLQTRLRIPTWFPGDHERMTSDEAAAFSLSACRNFTIASVSRAQYWSSASLILACSIQSSSTNTMR